MNGLLKDMKKAFFFLLLSLLASAQAMACRCANPEPNKAYARADAVALVKIMSVMEAPEGMTRMEAEVFWGWKSKVAGEMNTLVVFSRTDACPYVGQEGETHLLYLKKDSSTPEGFLTANCMGNWPVQHAQAKKHIQWLKRHAKRVRAKNEN